MYYIRFIINFKKTASSPPYSPHVKVDIEKAGNDLQTYNSPFTQNCMNRKKILNIALDKTHTNSAPTVKMVKDLEAKLGPYTKNNIYRKGFEQF